MRKVKQNIYFIFTILFFALGFFNIMFAWLGFACMLTPFIMLAVNKKKTWCQKYCPRASLFSVLLQGKKNKRPAPKWLTKGNGKWIMLIYFSFNMFILVMSTIMVARGRIDAMESIRFLLAFRLPWEVPQLVQAGFAPQWAVHLSFRIYSMMFTTTVLGLILGWLYLPRTWCAICPINTLSDAALGKYKKKNGEIISKDNDKKLCS